MAEGSTPPTPGEAPKRDISDARIHTVCLMILTGIAVAVALHHLATIMVPLSLSLFLCYGLTPLIDHQVALLRIPRALAVATTAGLGVVLLLLALQVVSSSASQLDAKRGVYNANLKALVTDFTSWVRSNPLLRRMLPVHDTAAQTNTGDTTGSAAAPRGGFVDSVVGFIQQLLLSVSAAGFNIVGQAFLVLTFMLFFLFGRSVGHAPEGTIWREVERKVQSYISTKVFLSLLTGGSVGVTLALLGVDMALAIGVLTFMLNFIPNIGSIIAVALPIPIVFLGSDLSVTAKVLAFAIPLAIQMSVGNLLEPKIMGNSFDLHPVIILIALIFWGMIWGVVGMFLAVPMTAVLKLFLERLDLTAPIARAMAGRMMYPPEGDRADGDPAA